MWAGRSATVRSWREYGIPAVLGTGSATKRIHSDQVITVDGSAGVVTLSKNGESKE
jgi:pyruvate,water dikinase